MPELPEVERARRIIERVARCRRIAKVTCARDTIVFDGVSGSRLRRALTGQTVLGVARRGKHLWLELDRRPWPCFHLGMTGAFHTPGETPLRLASSPAVEETSWPPRFTKLRLVMDDGGELAMTNKRRLGRIRLLNDPPGEPPVNRLGFDSAARSAVPGAVLRPRGPPVDSDQGAVAGSGVRRGRPATGSPTRCSIKRGSIPDAGQTSFRRSRHGGCAPSSSLSSRWLSVWMPTSRGFLEGGSFTADGNGTPRRPRFAATVSSI